MSQDKSHQHSKPSHKQSHQPHKPRLVQIRPVPYAFVACDPAMMNALARVTNDAKQDGVTGLSMASGLVKVTDFRELTLRTYEKVAATVEQVKSLGPTSNVRDQLAKAGGDTSALDTMIANIKDAAKAAQDEMKAALRLSAKVIIFRDERQRFVLELHEPNAGDTTETMLINAVSVDYPIMLGSTAMPLLFRPINSTSGKGQMMYTDDYHHRRLILLSISSKDSPVEEKFFFLEAKEMIQGVLVNAHASSDLNYKISKGLLTETLADTFPKAEAPETVMSAAFAKAEVEEAAQPVEPTEAKADQPASEPAVAESDGEAPTPAALSTETVESSGDAGTIAVSNPAELELAARQAEQGGRRKKAGKGVKRKGDKRDRDQAEGE